MTVVTTEGTAERFVPSERCTLVIQIARRADTADAATDAAVLLTNAVAADAVALRADGSATWHAVSTVTTYPRSHHDDKGGERIDFAAQSTVRIKLNRLELVGSLMSRFGAAGHTVYPEWALTDKTKKDVQRSVRIDAVRNARERAEDFAAALDGRITGVLEVKDAAAGFSSGPTRAASAAASGQGQTVTIPEQTVSAKVIAVFSVE